MPPAGRHDAEVSISPTWGKTQLAVGMSIGTGPPGGPRNGSPVASVLDSRWTGRLVARTPLPAPTHSVSCVRSPPLPGVGPGRGGWRVTRRSATARVNARVNASARCALRVRAARDPRCTRAPQPKTWPAAQSAPDAVARAAVRAGSQRLEPTRAPHPASRARATAASWELTPSLARMDFT